MIAGALLSLRRLKMIKIHFLVEAEETCKYFIEPVLSLGLKIS